MHILPIDGADYEFGAGHEFGSIQLALEMNLFILFNGNEFGHTRKTLIKNLQIGISHKLHAKII